MAKERSIDYSILTAEELLSIIDSLEIRLDAANLNLTEVVEERDALRLRENTLHNAILRVIGFLDSLDALRVSDSADRTLRDYLKETLTNQGAL